MLLIPDLQQQILIFLVETKIYLVVNLLFFRFKIKQDSVWCDVDLQNSSILEIQFPVDSLIVKPKPSEHSAISQCIVKDELILECTKESTAQLLALAVDHIDILLEDWYPTLGTRFVHTSEGKFLITRLVPCPECMDQAPYDLDNFDTSHPSTSQVQDVLRVEVDQSRNYSRDMHRIRKSQESSTSEGDSGVDPDSSVSSRNVSMEGHPNLHQDEILKSPINYSWLVEECILASYNDRFLTCPSHGQIKLARIAPDAVSNLTDFPSFFFSRVYDVFVKHFDFFIRVYKGWGINPNNFSMLV